VFGGRETASGLVQALQHGKPWLWIGLLGLVIAAAAWPLPASRLQGGLLAGGGALGLVGLLARALASARRAGPTNG
jgi:iron(III) transport system permease protein